MFSYFLLLVFATDSTCDSNIKKSFEGVIKYKVKVEFLHNTGMADPKWRGFKPYIFGNFGQIKSFEGLPQSLRPRSPDYVLLRVYQ